MRNRKSNRLFDYDYSNEGLYYVTLCTKERIEWFGKINNYKILLDDYGVIVKNFWEDIPKHYNNVLIDEYVIIPNHIHGIIIINKNNVGTEHCSVPNNHNNHQKARTEKCSIPTKKTYIMVYYQKL
ncbi:MAG: hypothetical protein EPN82_16235 [Bacteroidetes bacterium]|nr:MAG: hypothetical protein EPN82_16235 [Bacteroidota bacterium]